MVEIIRSDDWPKLLSEYITERRKMLFEWGTNDCMKFTACGVEILTGLNFYYDFPEYSDEAGAKEILEANGGIAKIISNFLGPGRRDMLNAGRGDVVIAKLSEVTAGLVDDSGAYFVVVTEKNGLIRLPLSSAWRYWSY